MKKILLIFVLIFSGVWGEDSKDSQWRGFFGVEAGAGIYGMGKAFIGAYNPLFSFTTYSFGLGYSGGIVGGLQKYTSEKVGIRHNFGFSIAFIPSISSIQNKTYKDWCIFKCKNAKSIDYQGRNAQNYNISYALDGLFDLAKSGNTRFGMNLGVSLTLTISDGESGYYVETPTEASKNIFGIVANLGMRLGFYTQFDNSILDANINLPLGGFGGANPIYGNTLTLSYKYLF